MKVLLFLSLLAVSSAHVTKICAKRDTGGTRLYFKHWHGAFAICGANDSCWVYVSAGANGVKKVVRVYGNQNTPPVMDDNTFCTKECQSGSAWFTGVVSDADFPPGIPLVVLGCPSCNVITQNALCSSDADRTLTNPSGKTELPPAGDCPQLTVANAVVSTTKGLLVDSIATVTCDAGFVSTGDVQRTCVTNAEHTKSWWTGNPHTCEDEARPSIICPSSVILNTDAGKSFATITTALEASTTDSSPTHLRDLATGAMLNVAAGTQSTILPSASVGKVFALGSTTLAAEVCDTVACISCQFSVTVVDTEKPQVKCTDVEVPLAPGSAVSAPTTWTVTTATDNVGVASTYIGPDKKDTITGIVFPLGSTTVQIGAFDFAGNEGSCSFTVTVKDKEAPTVLCPGGFTVNEGSDVSWGVISVSDNVPGQNIVASGSHQRLSTFPKGNTVVTYTAADSSGNIGSCSFTVTVNSNLDPQVKCPPSMLVHTEAGKPDVAVTWAAPIMSDKSAAGTVSITQQSHSSGDRFGITGTTGTDVTYEVTDNDGNKASCTFQIFVIDTEAPVISGCPAAIVIDAEPDKNYATVTWTAPTASDNSGATPSWQVLNNLSPGSQLSLGTHILLYRAFDAAGNHALCSPVTITVKDTQAPKLSCTGGGAIIPADPGRPTALYAVSGAASDNSGVVTLYSSQDSTRTRDNMNVLHAFPIGQSTITIFAVDESGNVAKCINVVTVEDTQNPTVSCPADISVPMDQGKNTAAVGSFVATGSDNSGFVSITCDKSSTASAAGSYGLGDTTVTWTATDAAGLTATCSSVITVVDTQLPSIVCPVEVTMARTADKTYGDLSSVVDFQATASDNNAATVFMEHAGMLTYGTATQSIKTRFSLGETVVTFTATDPSGNSAACTSKVTVINNAPSAADDTLVVIEDSAATDIHVLANDKDVDGDTLTVTISTGPTSGTASTDGTKIVYKPNANYQGVDEIHYSVSDGLASRAAVVHISIVAGNDPPTIELVSSSPMPILLGSGSAIAKATFVVQDIDDLLTPTPDVVKITLQTDGGGFASLDDSYLKSSAAGQLNILQGDANAFFKLVFTGTIAAVNLALAKVYYAPDAAYIGADRIVATVSDMGAGGAGGEMKDTAVFHISVACSPKNIDGLDLICHYSSGKSTELFGTHTLLAVRGGNLAAHVGHGDPLPGQKDRDGHQLNCFCQRIFVKGCAQQVDDSSSSSTSSSSTGTTVGIAGAGALAAGLGAAALYKIRKSKQSKREEDLAHMAEKAQKGSQLVETREVELSAL